MVREHKATSATQTLVLYALSAFANDAGECWPSLRKLGLATGLGKSAICDALGALEDGGRIIRQKGGPKAGSTSYKLVRLPDNVVRETDKGSAPAGQPVVRQLDTKLPVEGPKKVPKKKPAKQVAPLALPDWLPVETWDAWLADRKERRKPVTTRAQQRQLKALSDWREQGQDPVAVINQSIANGWIGLFPIKSNGSNGNGRGAMPRAPVPPPTCAKCRRPAKQRSGGQDLCGGHFLARIYPNAIEEQNEAFNAEPEPEAEDIPF